MAAEIITKEDLQEFGQQLLNQIKGLLGQAIEEPKKWLKSYQVKNMLKISDNTLQTLRDNGTIPFTKIGGILYYSIEDINRVLSGEVKSKRIKIMKNVWRIKYKSDLQIFNSPFTLFFTVLCNISFRGKMNRKALAEGERNVI